MNNGIPNQGSWNPGMLAAGQQIRVDLTKATQVSCACGCKYFTQAITVHTISALVSPTGQELTAQAPVLLCRKCKRVLPLGKNEQENKS